MALANSPIIYLRVCVKVIPFVLNLLYEKFTWCPLVLVLWEVVANHSYSSFFTWQFSSAEESDSIWTVLVLKPLYVSEDPCCFSLLLCHSWDGAIKTTCAVWDAGITRINVVEWWIMFVLSSILLLRVPGSLVVILLPCGWCADVPGNVPGNWVAWAEYSVGVLWLPFYPQLLWFVFVYIKFQLAFYHPFSQCYEILLQFFLGFMTLDDFVSSLDIITSLFMLFPKHARVSHIPQVPPQRCGCNLHVLKLLLLLLFI